MIAVLVALIGLVGTVLAAWITREGRRTRRSHEASNEVVLASVHRLEGKVDLLAENVSSLTEWRTLHDATPHPPLQVVPVVPAAVAATRRRRRP